jgi:hypothetical protein
MPVTVKVQYGEKLFKLSPGVSSLQQVHEEMMRRYPSRQLSLEYFYGGENITDLAALIQNVLKSAKTSIKLTAVGADLDVSRVSDCSIIEIVSS